MKKIYLLIISTFLATILLAQQNITPTIQPASFNSNTEITVTYDVTNTPLAPLDAAYIWVWIPDSNINAKYNINPANSNTPLSDNAKFVKSESGGKTYFSIIFKPQDFFSDLVCIENKLGMLIKGNDWSNGQSKDYIATMTPLTECFVTKLISPIENPLFIEAGGTLLVDAESSQVATFTLSVDGAQVNQQSGIKTYSFDYAIPQSTGIYPVELYINDAQNDTTITFNYLVNTPSDQLERPAGIIPGINYYENDPTKATVCLLAPGKSAVYLLGEFNEFEILPENKMFRDGEYFWATVTGLTAGVEYAYQYLVDGVFLADPFADKILDPDDINIPSSSYPNLKQYPTAALRDKWYKNRLAVIQTAQLAYEWQVENFTKPANEKLVVYELLIRDFFDADSRNYQSLIDTIGYFKKLGVNAIELMPIMEFSGNNSWGYNPTFMFAPDKYYGTKNKLKEFVDKCHQNGIAVILDIAMNHHDVPNPYVMMDFDFSSFAPTAKNKWFNVTATHPYSVFFDMNHESLYTKAYLDTVNYYWLKEYKIDGFRFDLSKGFTQNVRCGGSNSNEVCIGQRDDTRIAILKRMGDKIWSHFPNAYVILEHFADNSEETELANYGFMLWGNLNYSYSQNSKGFASNADISWVSHKSRGWNKPHVVGYMESHDEERMMYRNLQEGNSAGTYFVSNKVTALNRVKEAAAFFLTIPGPKMIWQFGELGYDYSINYNDRVGVKPVKWEYYSEAGRQKLFKTFAHLIKLRNQYDVFQTTDFVIAGGSTLLKQITLRNSPYTATPANADEMNVHVIANFDVTTKTISANFPHTGNWYHYFSDGQLLEVAATPANVILEPGEFRIYTDVLLPSPEVELMPFVRPAAPALLSLEEDRGKIIINWSDESTIETNYKIYRRQVGETFEEIGADYSDVTEFTDTYGLKPLIEYEYVVEAINKFGVTESNVLSIITTNLVLNNEEGVNKRYINYYPNPTKKWFTIISNDDEVMSFRLLSADGKTIEPHAISPDTWDLNHVSSGFYIGIIQMRSGLTEKVKIVKQ